MDFFIEMIDISSTKANHYDAYIRQNTAEVKRSLTNNAKDYPYTGKKSQ